MKRRWNTLVSNVLTSIIFSLANEDTAFHDINENTLLITLATKCQADKKHKKVGRVQVMSSLLSSSGVRGKASAIKSTEGAVCGPVATLNAVFITDNKIMIPTQCYAI